MWPILYDPSGCIGSSRPLWSPHVGLRVVHPQAIDYHHDLWPSCQAVLETQLICFCQSRPAWMPSPPGTASASSPEYRSIPRSSMAPRSKLQLHLDSLNQALAQHRPIWQFYWAASIIFQCLFPPSVPVPRSAWVDVGAVASCITAGPVLLPSTRKPRQLERHRLSDMEGVSCQPTSIYWTKSVSSAFSGIALLIIMPAPVKQC